ncbi:MULTISPECIES: DUF6745 domain-containing protein [unclassified Nostoc]|uniref:DUF6745 domain-containing protein n=1 Tax=unclassified Nostoc TaxID=2593658 RepID=UPI001DAAC145|nr:hypothetical protein [Nostoc sp. JL23]MBN3878852.1 hypothetical protein [Nostoc sp. JL23]
MSLIEKLTPEQEALIPVYREKWRAIALSTERIDCEKAAKAVKATYVLIGMEEPEIVFYDSPNAALITTLSKLSQELDRSWVGSSWDGSDLWGELCIYELPPANVCNDLEDELYKQIDRELDSLLRFELKTKLENSLNNCNHCWELWSELDRQLESQLQVEVENAKEDCIHYEILACCASLKDFCISVLNCVYDQVRWNSFESVVKECGWIFAGKNTCIVCDRPTKLSFDNQNRLHAEGEPAIEFIDGYSLYSYHGVTLPEKYGKIHPEQWQSQWLLTEENAELRRVLIQGIGYARICQELQAVELDTWHEYTLLKIDADVDEESIHLLKMTCPSTRFIHALRVAPNMNSAREAIRWVNWGIDPEEFGVQT